MRIKVACINWDHKDAAHAVVYFLFRDGDATGWRYFDKWPDAIAWATDFRIRGDAR